MSDYTRIAAIGNFLDVPIWVGWPNHNCFRIPPKTAVQDFTTIYRGAEWGRKEWHNCPTLAIPIPGHPNINHNQWTFGYTMVDNWPGIVRTRRWEIKAYSCYCKWFSREVIDSRPRRGALLGPKYKDLNAGRVGGHGNDSHSTTFIPVNATNLSIDILVIRQPKLGTAAHGGTAQYEEDWWRHLQDGHGQPIFKVVSNTRELAVRAYLDQELSITWERVLEEVADALANAVSGKNPHSLKSRIKQSVKDLAGYYLGIYDPSWMKVYTEIAKLEQEIRRDMYQSLGLSYQIRSYYPDHPDHPDNRGRALFPLEDSTGQVAERSEPLEDWRGREPMAS